MFSLQLNLNNIANFTNDTFLGNFVLRNPPLPQDGPYVPSLFPRCFGQENILISKDIFTRL